MKCAAWRAFLCSSVLFLLACGACDYRAREYSLGRLVFKGLEVLIVFAYGGADVSESARLGVVLFIASLSVAAGGAMRWWRDEVEGAAGVSASTLDIRGGATVNGGTTEGTRDTAPAEVAALPEPGPPPEDARAFAHFDERGRSPLERVLARD